MRFQRLIAGSIAVGALALAGSAHAALTQVSNEAFRGGVAADSFGVVSTVQLFAGGTLKIQLPRGAKVRKAWLLSSCLDTTNLTATGLRPAPAVTPRGVILGPGNTLTRQLEGPYDAASNVPSYGGYITDVTALAKTLLETGPGGSAPGGIVEVPIRERGDEGSDPAIQILGHTLVVTYDLGTAPFRNVAILLGSSGRGTNGTINFAKKVANRCTAANPRSEPFVLSASVSDEYDDIEEDTTISINNVVVTSRAGGADDAVAPARSHTEDLFTGGSFGADDQSRPIGIKNDSFANTPPTDGRFDDELHDMQAIILDGAASATYAFSGNDADEDVGALVLQSLARAADDDADGDGISDTIEGDCNNDADTDTLPDYLDIDSDNDCIADGDPREAGGARTDPNLPAGPHCSGATPFCVIEGPGGVCRPCAADFGSNVPASCTDPASPICLKSGANAGTCAPKAPNGEPTLNGEACAPDAAPRGKATTCASGVCDLADGRCGLLSGSPCSDNGQCRSGSCDSQRCSGDGPPPPPPPGGQPGGSLEGGSFSCNAANASSGTPFAVLLAAIASVFVRRRRR